MPPTIYSETFLKATGLQVETSWTVPAGRRAVVRSVVATTAEEVGAYFWLYVGDFPVYAIDFQATRSGQSIDMRLVAYAGESVRVYTSKAQVYVIVAGYLFNDDSGASAAPGVVDRVKRGVPRSPAAAALSP